MKNIAREFSLIKLTSWSHKMRDQSVSLDFFNLATTRLYDAGDERSRWEKTRGNIDGVSLK